MESLLFPIIMLAVTLIGGGILLLFLKTSKKTPQTDAGSAAMQTAQQFINVKDIRDKYLYTRGGMVFIYLRIHAISIDLYSKSEKNVLIKTLTAELSDIQYPFKFMALSRPVDISPLITVPLLFPVFLVLGIGTFFSESGKAEKMVKKRREEIEFELPRFVATITQELMASRDILSMLETYQKNAGPALRNELAITTADMRTGNYEAALTRLEARVSSAMLSDVVRGLIGCIRGDDGVTFFRMLSHDMKQLEVQRLKRLAMERPPKIRRYSFLLLACMLLIYMGVMGYQILGTMSGMF